MYVPKRATRGSVAVWEKCIALLKDVPIDDDHVKHLCFLFGPSRHGVMWLRQHLVEHPQNVSVMGKTRVDILVESMK